jgi:hypothetical protein
MNRRAAVTIMSAAIAASVAVTGCGSSYSSGGVTYYKNGRAGLVMDRDIEHGRYELETKDAKGKKHEFYVTGSVYNDCHEYSYYPSCVKHSKTYKPKPKKTNKVYKAPKNSKKTHKKFSFKRSKKR